MPSKKKSESNPSGKDQAVGRNGMPKPTGSADAKKSPARPEAGPDRKLAAATPSEKARKASRINTTEHAKEPAHKPTPAKDHAHATAQASHKPKEQTSKPTPAPAKDHAAPKDHGPIPNPVRMSDTPATTKRRRGLVGRVVYGTAYAVSYGLAFPVMLLVHALPKENALVLGFVEGAGAARESVAGLLESPKALGHSASSSSPTAALAAQPA